MNHFRTLLHASQLEQGDIIQISTAASRFVNRDKRRGPQGAKPQFTYGYVLDTPLYQSQKDDIAGIEIFEILPINHASRLDYLYVPILHDDTGHNLGLHEDHEWAAVLEQIHIDVTPVNMGQREALVQRVGKISNSVAESKLLEFVQNRGGLERLRYGYEEGPRFSRPNPEAWGVLTPVGIHRENEADEVYVRKYRRKKVAHDFTGKVVDIDIADAVRFLDLPQEVADIFQTETSSRPALQSLRQIWNIADKRPEKIVDYVPKTVNRPILLQSLLKADLMDAAIANGLIQPRKGENVPPILDLQTAYRIVSKPNSEDTLKRYSYMGPKNIEHAKKQIPRLYNELCVTLSKEEKAASLTASIKDVWKNFMAAYLESKTTGNVPEHLRREDGTPVWKIVELKP